MIHNAMGEVTPFPRPINWAELRSDEAEKVIRERAEDTGNVIFSDHAWDRVSEREITRQDVFRILQQGYCQEPAKDEFGRWKVIVTKRLQGSREAGVITVIVDDEEKLIIPTVQWMDLR